MKDEIFGPLLPIISFENLDKVIAKVKEREKPLALYVYSKSKKIRTEIKTPKNKIFTTNRNWVNKTL